MSKALLLALGLSPKKDKHKDAKASSILDDEDDTADTTSEETSEEMTEAAEDVLRAIEDKDAPALAEALRLFALLCAEES